MAGHDYLDGGVIKRLKLAAATALREVGVCSPPVVYGDIFENARLDKFVVGPSTPEFVDLRKEIGPEIDDTLRGVLFVPQRKIVVVDEYGYEKRTNFVLGHEFGHWHIPSHQAILWKCTQFDLSCAARKQLEREANFFSSELNFMGTLFFEHLQSSPLSMGLIKKLSDMFKMSVEATLRRAVEIEERPCAFLSLKENKAKPKELLAVKYAVHSKSFIEQFQQVNRHHTFSSDHRLASIVTDPSLADLRDTTCELFLGEKKVPLEAQVWKNNWNIFVLLQPQKVS